MPDPAGPMNADDLRAILFQTRGNVTKAAEFLEVDSERLRKFIHAIPRLRDAMAEIMERGVDQAVDVVYEGLADERSFQNRFYAAKVMLQSEAARRRGFGNPVHASIEVKTVSGPPEIRWLDPNDGHTIEHQAAEEPGAAP